AAKPELFIVSRHSGAESERARLLGVRLAVCNELEDGERLHEAQLKQLAGGGDLLQARRLYGESFELRPTDKMLLIANHQPVVRGTDAAIWNRQCVFPFDVSIPLERRNPHLVDQLVEELPGILAWAVQGCLAWQKRRLSERPDAVVVATESYR